MCAGGYMLTKSIITQRLKDEGAYTHILNQYHDVKQYFVLSCQTDHTGNVTRPDNLSNNMYLHLACCATTTSSSPLSDLSVQE